MMAQLQLFESDSEINLTEELFQAYFDARKNKRNTINALAFEKHFEANLFELKEEITSGNYSPSSSICFIVNRPVMREIFAADFKDRVVHHWIINKLNPFFENIFIHDSYACRIGKGTHLGIRQLDNFIKQCSQNYTTDCYVLKLDIKGFFMHINKDILLDKLNGFIHQCYTNPDKELLLSLCRKVIYNDPTKNCIVKGATSNWAELPPDKSLFHSPPNCGLPIGNLTSQIFANFYLNSFDHFVKNDLGMPYYGRYVDDFVLVHQDKDHLRSMISPIAEKLNSSVQLTLHPKKIYLQHYSKGVRFLGTVIKPNRIYIANRTKGNFYRAIEKQNEIARDHKPTKEEQVAFLCCMNSYLGILKHYKTYKLRKQMIFKNLSGWWWNYFYLSNGISKFVMKIKTVK